jgi:hypothetical protein
LIGIIVATSGLDAQPSTPARKPYVTCGIFIGKIEEGARVFTPVRLLPFDHPEALGHQFPTALELHRSEYEIQLILGRHIGLGLQATLQRYPMQPIERWKFTDFDVPPAEQVRIADTLMFDASASEIPGLRAIAFKDRFPLSFIVDTRQLTLAQRGMKQSTSMGLDIDRSQLVNALTNIGLRIPAHGVWVVMVRPASE